MKASDNPFTSLLVVEGSAPASPSSGDQRLFVDSADHLLKLKNSGGTVTSVGGGGGSGALALLEQHTASGSASLDFTTALSATYDEYLIELIDLVPATNGTDLQLVVSTDGGSTWLAGTNYRWGVSVLWNTGNPNGYQASGGARVSMTGYEAGGVSNTASEGGYGGSCRLFNPLGTTAAKRLQWQGGARMGDGNFGVFTGAAQVLTTSAVNAIRFKQASGNIASGTIRVYGIAKS